MADDELKDAGGPETGRPKREPPTIDLDASEVSGETRAAAEAKAEAHADAAPAPEQDAAPSKPISPWVIAPFSGAVAAALVIAVGWMLGWPPVQAPPAAPQVTAGAFDELGKRVAGLEAKTSKPAAPVSDPAAAARIDTLDKSLAALRSDIASQRAQSDKLASAINDLKSAPRDSAGNVDLSGITGRIVELERKAQAQGEARESEKVAEAKSSDKPADDVPLRRVVAAALLDVAVRHGDAYAETLKVAKALSADPDKLKALDPFAEKGVPSAPQLNRELLTLVPKLSPSADTATTGTSIVDRLQAGAAKLVRVERTDTTGNDRGAIVARVTAAALRNDFTEARRDLAELTPADRAPAQAWLDKAVARDAALAASRQFADDAMASLAKAGQ